MSSKMTTPLCWTGIILPTTTRVGTVSYCFAMTCFGSHIVMHGLEPGWLGYDSV